MKSVAFPLLAPPPPPPDPQPPPPPTPTAEPAPTATETPAPAPTATETPTPDPTPGAEGATCGSRGLPPCGKDLFCDFPAGSQCGALDKGGSCKPIPQVCTREFHAVCGCDGTTYPNPCSANAKGISVSKDGKCD
ncbi:MAG: serine protease [Polyangiaceae bacterium]